jgi:dihydroorotate dehydrogenase
VTLSAGLCAVYYLDARSAIHQYLLTPLLRRAVDAETGHRFAVKVLQSGLGPCDPLSDDERLKSQASTFQLIILPVVNPSQVWGYEISNPVGLAAGFDKDGQAIDGKPFTIY